MITLQAQINVSKITITLTPYLSVTKYFGCLSADVSIDNVCLYPQDVPTFIDTLGFANSLAILINNTANRTAAEFATIDFAKKHHLPLFINGSQAHETPGPRLRSDCPAEMRGNSFELVP